MSASHSLEITRLLHAPLDRVYAKWSDVSLARQWWGPDGIETIELIFDARPGGEFRWKLRSPDGDIMSVSGAFREVIPEAKLVYTWKWEDDPQWKKHESVVQIEFQKIDRGTTEIRLAHSDLPSEESRGNHLRGWNGALDKFERLFAR